MWIMKYTYTCKLDVSLVPSFYCKHIDKGQVIQTSRTSVLDEKQIRFKAPLIDLCKYSNIDKTPLFCTSGKNDNKNSLALDIILV